VVPPEAILTPEQIEEIEARANAATHEPLVKTRYDHGGGRMFRDGEAGQRKLVIDAYDEPDREFYFHALEDVLLLLATLRVLERERDELKAAFDRYADHEYSCAVTDEYEQRREKGCTCGFSEAARLMQEAR